MTEQNSPFDMNALLAAAAQPGTEEELAGMSAYIEAFTAEVATPNVVPMRSHTMFAGRITRRAAAMVAVTLLAAGTAAAAATDHLPSPFKGADQATEAVQGQDIPESTETSSPESSDPSTSVDPSTSADQVKGPDAAAEAAFGLCQAWTKGGDKKADNPAFSALSDAATANSQTVAEYCADVKVAHEASIDDHSSTSDDESDDQDDDADEDTSSSITLPEQAESHASLPENSGKGSPSTTDDSHSGEGKSHG